MATTGFKDRYGSGTGVVSNGLSLNGRTKRIFPERPDTKTYTPTPVKNIVENKQVAVIPRVV